MRHYDDVSEMPDAGGPLGSRPFWKLTCRCVMDLNCSIQLILTVNVHYLRRHVSAHCRTRCEPYLCFRYFCRPTMTCHVLAFHSPNIGIFWYICVDYACYRLYNILIFRQPIISLNRQLISIIFFVGVIYPIWNAFIKCFKGFWIVHRQKSHLRVLVVLNQIFCRFPWNLSRTSFTEMHQCTVWLEWGGNSVK